MNFCALLQGVCFTVENLLRANVRPLCCSNEQISAGNELEIKISVPSYNMKAKEEKDFVVRLNLSEFQLEYIEAIIQVAKEKKAVDTFAGISTKEKVAIANFFRGSTTAYTSEHVFMMMCHISKFKKALRQQTNAAKK